jgi:thiamine biosynthesis lipoprotein ApbE
MLAYALEVARKTDGYFDPTIAGKLSSLGYGRDEHRVHSVGYQNVVMDGLSVLLASDVILEFGGVGKGYLIDVIRSMIIDYGTRHSEERRIQDPGSLNPSYRQDDGKA